MRRFAPYEPDCVLCLTGAAGDRSEDEARALVVAGLQRIAAAADEAGVRLGLEPIHVSERAGLTIVTSVPEALDLLGEAGLPDVGIMFDLWHLGDTPRSNGICARTSHASRVSTSPTGSAAAAATGRSPARASPPRPS